MSPQKVLAAVVIGSFIGMMAVFGWIAVQSKPPQDVKIFRVVMTDGTSKEVAARYAVTNRAGDLFLDVDSDGNQTTAFSHGTWKSYSTGAK